eukprot:Rmarinus@m.2357
MVSKTASLTYEQRRKLNETISAIDSSQSSHEERSNALSYLKGFCEGSPGLRVAIGSREFNTIEILFKILLQPPCSDRLLAFQLMELLLCSVPKNHKSFLALKGSVSSFVTFLRDLTLFVDKSSNPSLEVHKILVILADLISSQSKVRDHVLDEDIVKGIFNVLTLASLHRKRGGEQARAWSPVVEAACTLINELAGRTEEIFRKGGVLALLLEEATSVLKRERAVLTAILTQFGLPPFHEALQAPIASIGMSGMCARDEDDPFPEFLLYTIAYLCVEEQGTREAIRAKDECLEDLVWIVFLGHPRIRKIEVNGVPISPPPMFSVPAASYWSAQVLLANLQLGDKATQRLVHHKAAKIARGTAVEGVTKFVDRPPLSEFLALSKLFHKECINIREMHYDSDTVVASLQNISRAICNGMDDAKQAARPAPRDVDMNVPKNRIKAALRKTAAQMFFLHTRGSMDLLVSCLNNIDEEVMSNSCITAISLLEGNYDTQRDFLSRGGIAALSEVLHDYDVTIRKVGLQVLVTVSVLHPNRESLLSLYHEELRESGILSQVIEIVKEFPSEEVPLKVAEPALSVIAHVCSTDPKNREYIRQRGGMACLSALLHHIATNGSLLPRPDGSHVLHTATPSRPRTPHTATHGRISSPRALSPSPATIVPASDSFAGHSGGTTSGSGAGAFVVEWEGGNDGGRAVLCEAVCLALNNVTFQCVQAQLDLKTNGLLDHALAILRSDPPVRVHLAVMNLLVNCVDTCPENQAYFCTSAVADLLVSLFDDGSSSVAAVAMLFLSHLTWNNMAHQALFGRKPIVSRILRFIDQAMTHDSSRTAPGQRHVSGVLSKQRGSFSSSLPPAAAACVSDLPQPLTSSAAAASTSGSHANNAQQGAAPCASAWHGTSSSSTNAGYSAANSSTAPTVVGGAGTGHSSGLAPGAGAEAAQLTSCGSTASSSAADADDTESLDQQAFEQCLYALLALINMVYRNRAIQDLVASLSGVPIILAQLSSPVYEIRKCATLCLNNLVKGHEANAQTVLDAGGVEELVYVINDETDDQLSNRAFTTLTDMAAMATRRLLVNIAGSLRVVLQASEARGSEFCKERMGECASSVDELEKYLLVVNGLVYMSAEARKAAAEEFGLTPLLEVFTCSHLSPLIRVPAGNALVNLSSSGCTKSLQAKAKEQDAFGMLDRWLASCHVMQGSRGGGSGGCDVYRGPWRAAPQTPATAWINESVSSSPGAADGLEEAEFEDERESVYCLLQNLTNSNPKGADLLSACPAVLQVMMTDADTSGSRLRQLAADLLLSLIDQSRAVRLAFGALEVRPVVRRLREANLSQVLTGKAIQALRELDEESAARQC